jgi:hypothetical protein
MGDGDADMDGDVDGDDFLIWQSNFGSSAAGDAAVALPEPSTVLLLASLGLSLLAAGRGLCLNRRAK